MTRTNKNLKGVLPISIKIANDGKVFYFKNYKSFKYLMNKLIDIDNLNKCVYFEAKKGTSDKLPPSMIKLLKNPIEINNYGRH